MLAPSGKGITTTGSGKTVVALYALLRAVEQGYQAALMAPTETLAEQHFATLQALLPGELVPVGLLTGSTPFGWEVLGGVAFDEALRLLREEEPQKPSSRLSATDRGLLPGSAAITRAGLTPAGLVQFPGRTMS